VRHVPRPRTHALTGPRQQRDGSSDVAPLHVREPDGELRERAPQLPLVRRGGLPRGLEDLVRGERPLCLQQPLSLVDRLRRAAADLVTRIERDGLDALDGADLRLRLRSATPPGAVTDP